MRLTPDGVEADLDISSSAPPIPTRLTAAVADLSAVGEQYVDLRPVTATGPYLTNGSVIRQPQTQLPIPVTSLLTSVNSLALSLPLTQLRTLIGELATGFHDEGSNLQGLLDGNHALSQAGEQTVNQAKKLINDSRTVMSTQIAEARALNSFSASARQLAARLVASNSDLRRFITEAPRAAGQLDGLLTDTNPSLAVLIANLLTTSEVTMTRGQALDELLSALPADVAAGSTVINSNGARFGVALTFFSPLPCTAGYGGTQYRNGLDTSSGPPLNTGARCELPASSGVDVRGSAHAPTGGPVPSPASPGFASLLGVTP
jgi:phospholipid/cholesterol/gamma-HCH transport system substrate-binding protein